MSTWTHQSNQPINPNPSPCSPQTHRYVKRKVREEFHRNAGLVGEDAAAALAKAKTEKALIDRQVTVYEMFGDKTPSVIDFVKK